MANDADPKPEVGGVSGGRVPPENAVSDHAKPTGDENTTETPKCGEVTPASPLRQGPTFVEMVKSSVRPDEMYREEIVRSIFGEVGTVHEDFSCAVESRILLHGRMYVTGLFVCFYSNLFGFEKIIKIPFCHMHCITKEKTALFIPNAIAIITSKKEYIFRSFWDREDAYKTLRNCHRASQGLPPLNELGKPYSPRAPDQESDGGRTQQEQELDPAPAEAKGREGKDPLSMHQGTPARDGKDGRDRGDGREEAEARVGGGQDGGSSSNEGAGGVEENTSVAQGGVGEEQLGGEIPRQKSEAGST
ncbi:unnamed protein product, partial [Discosporangium mesarthrocarpum]